MIQWFKREDDKAMPKNKYGLLLCYSETCTQVVEPVIYQEQDEEDATHVATATVGVPTDGVASATAGSRTARAGVAYGDVGSPAARAGVTSGDVGGRAGVASTVIGSPDVGSRADVDHADVGSHTDRVAGGSPTAVLWSLGTVAGKPSVHFLLQLLAFLMLHMPAQSPKTNRQRAMLLLPSAPRIYTNRWYRSPLSLLPLSLLSPPAEQPHMPSQSKTMVRGTWHHLDPGPSAMLLLLLLLTKRVAMFTVNHHHHCVWLASFSFDVQDLFIAKCDSESK
jgi:hypothetical protein